jgi:type I restriction enzyme M protein
VQADGFSLDDKRNEIKENDLPGLLKQWKAWDDGKGDLSAFEDRKAKAFFVPRAELEENGFDLSISRYKEHIYEEIEYDDPEPIISTIRKNAQESFQALDKIEELLK